MAKIRPFNRVFVFLEQISDFFWQKAKMVFLKISEIWTSCCRDTLNFQKAKLLRYWRGKSYFLPIFVRTIWFWYQNNRLGIVHKMRRTQSLKHFCFLTQYVSFPSFEYYVFIERNYLLKKRFGSFEFIEIVWSKSMVPKPSNSFSYGFKCKFSDG